MQCFKISLLLCTFAKQAQEQSDQKDTYGHAQLQTKELKFWWYCYYLPMYIVNTRKFAHRKSIQVIISLSQDLWHFQSVCWGVQATTTTMAHNALKPGKKCYTINITPHFKVFALQFFISCYKFYILSLMNTLVHCAVSCNMKKYLPSLE